jgi:hypothetical protein
MLRATFALLFAIGSAGGASAATLSVTPDKLTYLVGETVTLTVIGDDGGASAFGIFGRLDYSGLLVDNGTRSQTQLVGQNGNWLKGTLVQGDDGTLANSWAFNQIAPFTDPLSPDTANNLPGTLAIVTLIATAVGVVDVNWNSDTGSGFELLFFGLTNAPGTAFTIVPEPATAALLALGASRQKSRS